ncbi:MAG: PAS domain-containing protein [Chitinophagaceae bacterium]
MRKASQNTPANPGMEWNHSSPPELTAADTVVNGFFTVDRNWKIVSWNHSAEQLLGVTSDIAIDQIFNKEFAKLLPVDLYHLYSEMLIQNRPVQFQKNLGAAGNLTELVTFYSNELLSVSFKGSGRMPVKPGITIIQHPAQQLKTINDLYRAVTEITNDCLWEWNLATSEIFWIDGGHKRHFGFEIVNMLIPLSFWVNRIHSDDRERVLGSLQKTIGDRSATIWESGYRFEKSDGAYIEVEDRALIIRDGQNEPIRLVGATCNVHDKKSLEKALVNERLAAQRELTHAVLTAQEKERAEIGEQLHDNLNQILAVTKLYLQMAIKSDSKRDEHLNKSLDFIVQVMSDIRRISKTLVIPETHIIGMTDNIRNLIRDITDVHPMKIQLLTNGIKDENLPDKLQVVIFRIIQQQIDNILKHSDATEASIEIIPEKNNIILVVKDNGKGCDLNSKKAGVGLLNIRSRADLFLGSVSIISEPQKGYELRVKMNTMLQPAG